MTWTMVDGAGMPSEQARVPADDPAVTLGWSVFETLGWPGADLTLHLDRLAASCQATHITMPDRDLLTREVVDVAGHFPAGARVRITLTGGGVRLVRAEALDPTRRHRPVRAIRGVHHHEPVLGGAVKHGSRLPWVIAVRNSGVDEVLLVDEGRFVEGTTSGILAVVQGTLYTPPDDGRVLASTTVISLLSRATALGIPVRREAPSATGPWDGLYIASAMRDIAPVIELDGEPLPCWEPVGVALREMRSTATVEVACAPDSKNS